jgi:hypothetical protein
VYYAYCDLPYGKEDQMLLIDGEASKALQNPKWSGNFLESFKGKLLSKNQVQWLDLSFCSWPILIGLPMVRTI